MNFGIVIVVAILALWGMGVFIGAIGGLSKPFTKSPSAIDSSKTKSQERKTLEETEEKRQKTMEDIKQKLQDAKKY